MLYSSVLERREDYATLKALGASQRYLLRLIVLQAMAGSLGGFAAGVLLTAVATPLLLYFVPALTVRYTLPAAVAALAGTIVIGICGAIVPIHLLLPGMSAVVAVALSKAYPGPSPVPAVTDVSLTVEPGEVVLISGPNGSGKTTLLAMLGGLLPPTSGTIEVAGERLGSLDPARLAAFRLRTIGFVFQSFRLLEELTAAENVRLVLELAGTSDAGARAQSLLSEMGMAERADRLTRHLSGGEKQRVAIARALACDPAVLLADEPTGNLDSRAGEQAVQLLGQAARSRGKAAIIVSHDPRIEKHADRVLRMTDGRLT
jgi:putative ABC transport system ATP-binding protein